MHSTCVVQSHVFLIKRIRNVAQSYVHNLLDIILQFRSEKVTNMQSLARQSWNSGIGAWRVDFGKKWEKIYRKLVSFLIYCQIRYMRKAEKSEQNMIDCLSAFIHKVASSLESFKKGQNWKMSQLRFCAFPKDLCKVFRFTKKLCKLVDLASSWCSAPCWRLWDRRHSFDYLGGVSNPLRRSHGAAGQTNVLSRSKRLKLSRRQKVFRRRTYEILLKYWYRIRKEAKQKS